MQKALNPASFLSVALKNESKNDKKAELYIIREEKEKSPVSNLFALFFGNSKKINKSDSTEEIPSEPDYFSSYE